MAMRLRNLLIQPKDILSMAKYPGDCLAFTSQPLPADAVLRHAYLDDVRDVLVLIVEDQSFEPIESRDAIPTHGWLFTTMEDL